MTRNLSKLPRWLAAPVSTTARSFAAVCALPHFQDSSCTPVVLLLTLFCPCTFQVALAPLQPVTGFNLYFRPPDSSLTTRAQAFPLLLSTLFYSFLTLPLLQALPDLRTRLRSRRCSLRNSPGLLGPSLSSWSSYPSTFSSASACTRASAPQAT